MDFIASSVVWVYEMATNTVTKARTQHMQRKTDEHYFECKLSQHALGRGILWKLVRYFPDRAVKSATNRNVLQLLNWSEGDSHLTSISKKVLAGSVGGGASLFFLFPIDFCVTLLEQDEISGKKKYNHFTDVFDSSIKEDGWRSLWRGYALSTAGILVYNITYVGLYDTLEPSNPTWIKQLLFKSFVSITAGLVVYPIETVAIRQMTKTNGTTSAYEIAKRISSDFGIKGFYEGASLVIVANFLDTILIMLMKQFRMIFKKETKGLSTN